MATYGIVLVHGVLKTSADYCRVSLGMTIYGIHIYPSSIAFAISAAGVWQICTTELDLYTYRLVFGKCIYELDHNTTEFTFNELWFKRVSKYGICDISIYMYIAEMYIY